MIQSVYTGKLALIAQQRRVDTVANNIANIDTYGYKSSRITFKEALYSTLIRPVGNQNVNLERGNGVLVSGTARYYDDGTPIQTGVNLDFCLQGDGFFTVQNAGGELMYTRNGAFKVSTEADGNYLVTAQGYYVMDANRNRIKLPANTEELTVNEAGAMSIGTEAPFATLNIASFANNEGLSAVSGNCYMPTVASGPALKAQNFVVKQGFMEGSNVDLALEMTRLIRAQRAFSYAGQAVMMGNQMDAVANDLRT
jgi:flagellar basal-body rod protein FlgG